MQRLRTLGLVGLAVSGLTLAACSSPTSTTSTTAASTASTVAVGTTPAGTIGKEPDIRIPPGAAPTTLVTKDLIVGTGPAVKAGDKATVQYIGAAYSNHQVFDSSWSRGQPFPFVVGQGTVIPGWEQGIVGMQVGGRRLLVIPPNLAYGANSPGSGIGANDTLVFVVDLVKIN